VGDTVEWVNVGDNPHTTTSGAGCTADGIWTSALLSKGGKFSVIFDSNNVNQIGIIPYFCIPHCALNMRGSITVNP
jgi:plastocyanin